MRKIDKKTSVLVTLLVMLLSITVPGVNAAQNATAPYMDFDEIKSRSLETMEMNIKTLDTMQSGGNYEDMEGSITGLQEQLASLKRELESTEDEENLNRVMADFRVLMESAPEDIRKELRGNEIAAEPGSGNLSMDNNTMRGPAGQGNFHGGNDSIREEGFNGEKLSEELTGEVLDEENNGLLSSYLSGLINRIKAILG